MTDLQHHICPGGYPDSTSAPFVPPTNQGTLFPTDRPKPMIFWSKLDDRAIEPTRATPGDAGLDLSLIEDVTIELGCIELVDTGVAFAIPEGYVGLVFPRSSIGVKCDVTLANTVGVIDAGYRGPIKLALKANRTGVSFTAGTRVAQLVVTPCLITDAMQLDSLPKSVRGTGGFGSSGT